MIYSRDGTRIMFDSQEEVLKEIGNKPKILHLGTGSGKTLISLQEYVDNHSDKPLLVICPNGKFKEGGWDREIEVIEDYYSLALNYDIIPYSHLWLKRKIPKKIEYKHNDILDKYKEYFIIFDEVHFVKNPTSERGKTATALLRNSKGFIGLSATPMANGWIDTMNYFIWFNKAKNKTQFIRTYSAGLDKYYKPYGWLHNDLSELWKEISIFRDKHSMTDLPELIVKDIYFKKSPKYTKLLKSRILDGEVYDTVPKLYAGLRYYTNPKDKSEYIGEMFESSDDNIVVFYCFNKELEDIKKVIPKGKVVYQVNGHEYSLPTPDKWDTLTNTITLVQYKAGGTGIEMQFSNTVIFYSPDYSYQDFEQAMGRVYRTGQKRNVTVYQFKTRGTVEMDIWNALKVKKNFTPREEILK